MAGWALYTLLTTLLLVVAAVAAERLVRALRAPTRFVWIGAVAVGMALSGTWLVGRAGAKQDAASVAPGGASASRVERTEAGTGPRTGSTLILPRGRAADARGVSELVMPFRRVADLRFDTGRWKRYDPILIAVCATFAVVGVLVVIASLIRLRRMMRRLVRGDMDGIPVLFSQDLGPAAVGFLHRHVIVPRWVVALPAEERRTILLHEREHAAAGDPMLITLGALALALMPWNLPLWIAVAKLRFAVEADCDARVLTRSHCGARRYGALLLQVHEHGCVSRARGRLPVTAFVDSTSHLERRVRRMTNRQPKLCSLSTSAASVIALIVAAIAFSVRVSSAEPSVHAPDAAVQPSRPLPRVDSVAVPEVSGASGVVPDVEPLWGDALPQLANSERESREIPMRVMVPLQRLVANVAAVERTTAREAFVPETLLVRSSNSLWPMKARVTVADSAGMGRVLVTDTLGRALPWADTLIVDGPIRLILPDARFRLGVESLSGDLLLTTSAVPARDGKGGHWVSTLLGRSFQVARRTAGESAQFGATGAGYGMSRRAP